MFTKLSLMAPGLMTGIRLFEETDGGGTTSGAVDISGISTAMSSALAQTATDTVSMIGVLLPYAISIASAMLVISLGIKAFKKIAGK